MMHYISSQLAYCLSSVKKAVEGESFMKTTLLEARRLAERKSGFPRQDINFLCKQIEMVQGRHYELVKKGLVSSSTCVL